MYCETNRLTITMLPSSIRTDLVSFDCVCMFCWKNDINELTISLMTKCWRFGNDEIITDIVYLSLNLNGDIIFQRLHVMCKIERMQKFTVLVYLSKFSYANRNCHIKSLTKNLWLTYLM